MSLEEQIAKDLVQAMKLKEEVKVLTLRSIKSGMTNFSIEAKKDKLEDSDILTVVQKQVKQRRESYDVFLKAGRNDLAEKEKKEISILEAYLPKQLTDEEIKKLASEAIKKSGAQSKNDTGKVMKELMPLVKGKADGKRVNEILSSLLV